MDTPFAVTDGPNDFHWTGTSLHPGLADASPTLNPRRPNPEADALKAQALQIATEKTALQLEREAFQVQVATFQAEQAAVAKGKK